MRLLAFRSPVGGQGVKIRLGTITVTDAQRRAIRAHYGQGGLAQRMEVKEYVLACIVADLEQLREDYVQ